MCDSLHSANSSGVPSRYQQKPVSIPGFIRFLVITNLVFWYNCGYTFVMKTGVSLPDNIFNAAERHAKRMGVPRSRLYAIAISEYLKNQQGCGIKEALDRVYGSQPSKVDPILNAMQNASIRQEDW